MIPPGYKCILPYKREDGRFVAFGTLIDEIEYDFLTDFEKSRYAPLDKKLYAKRNGKIFCKQCMLGPFTFKEFKRHLEQHRKYCDTC